MIRIERVSAWIKEATEQFLWEQHRGHFGDRITHERYDMLKERFKKECNDPCNALFVALTETNEVVGCIALSKYDHRIEAFHTYYPTDAKIAEVARCYVDEHHRRQGIGAMLFEHASTFAQACDYETLYLHTHYFLPGGFSFWRAMGFEITLEEEGVWQTVHMEKLVEYEVACYA
jgi:GNAT superfamily N-acetyltransferase